MSREVRMVPANWQHPVDESGRPIPLSGGAFAKRATEWDAECAAWKRGEVRDYAGERYALRWKPKPESALRCKSFDDWDGPRPLAEDYMPEWPEAERTHLQMYETCTEGTPISPVCATPEELARWLADNKASAFGDETASYEEWLSTCIRGWAPMAVFGGGKGLRSWVADLAERKHGKGDGK